MGMELDEAADAVAVRLPDCGQRVSVESPRHAEKLWTHMIGFKPGGYLVLEKPQGAGATDGRSALKEGDSLVLRFMKDGSIFGFRTPVLSTMSMPYKLLFVAYPTDVARHSLRSSPRLQCYLPCEGKVGRRPFARAFVRDFSATGCQLRIPLEAMAEMEPVQEAEPVQGPEPVQDRGETGDGNDTGAKPEETGEPMADTAAGPESLEEETHPDASGRLTLSMQLPGEERLFEAQGDVLEWQTLPRYHALRVRFDEPQTALFELLSLHTMRFG